MIVLRDRKVMELVQPGVFALTAWDLLKERDDGVNISHKQMPTWDEHVAFIEANPYRAWLAICAILPQSLPQMVGTVYLTRQNEVGIFILKQYQGSGYAKDAIIHVLGAFRPLPAEPSIRPGHFVANINPANTASIRLFESLGAKHISNTYQL